MYEYVLHVGLPMELQYSKSYEADAEVAGSYVDWGILSKEIMEQIFARLPIKEAVRASCVCKHWQSIVFSRSFVTFILKFKIPRR
uniref:F-box domain-containing protein n=1 Tax=Physcomitrium patens TaxID=3218 RepID=A0A2K1L9H3_PHYPA|nr:hypothetical protein PHYPA_001112 [Physcomitrium patens]